MVGVKGRSGRPPGSTSWWRSPVAIAAHNLSVLMEMWVAGVPIRS